MSVEALATQKRFGTITQFQLNIKLLQEEHLKIVNGMVIRDRKNIAMSILLINNLRKQLKFC